MTHLFYLVLFFCMSVCEIQAFTPRSIYADDVQAEIQSEIQKHQPLKQLDLHNKGVIFASQDQLFDEKIATQFISFLEKLELESLDLSYNRLPEDSLPFFKGLLTQPQFRYLNVTVSGADSLLAIRRLTTALGRAGLGLDGSIAALKKVIWVQPQHLEQMKGKGLLQEPYYSAHRNYFREMEEGLDLIPSL